METSRREFLHIHDLRTVSNLARKEAPKMTYKSHEEMSNKELAAYLVKRVSDVKRDYDRELRLGARLATVSAVLGTLSLVLLAVVL